MPLKHHDKEHQYQLLKQYTTGLFALYCHAGDPLFRSRTFRPQQKALVFLVSTGRKQKIIY